MSDVELFFEQLQNDDDNLISLELQSESPEEVVLVWGDEEATIKLNGPKVEFVYNGDESMMMNVAESLNSWLQEIKETNVVSFFCI